MILTRPIRHRAFTAPSAALLAAVAATALAPQPVQAGSVLVERSSSSQSNLLAPGRNASAYMGWDTGSKSHNGKQVAGPFDLMIDGVQTYTFCVDLDQYLNIPSNGGRSYTMLSGLDALGFSPVEIGLTESLFEQYYPLASELQSGTASRDEKLQGVAFQVMLWELLLDDQFDLTTGNFNLDLNRGHSLTNDVNALAGGWYTSLDVNGFSDPSLRLNVIASGDSQDQIYMTSVPFEPEPVPSPAAAGVGMIGVGMLIGRRTRRPR